MAAQKSTLDEEIAEFLCDEISGWDDAKGESQSFTINDLDTLVTTVVFDCPVCGDDPEMAELVATLVRYERGVSTYRVMRLADDTDIDFAFEE